MIAAIDPDPVKDQENSYGISIKNYQWWRQLILISQLPDSDADRIGPVPAKKRERLARKVALLIL